MNLTRFSTFIALVVIVLGGLMAGRGFAQTRAELEQARQRMVEKVVIGSGVTEPRVVEAMRKTPRHEFVPRSLWKNAYFDMALPIGDRQTISSPFIVSYMTMSLELKPTDRVLEIGTGSGYQAAVLSPLASEVYTIEIVPELGQRAARTLKRLKYKNVHVKIGDGFKGWPEHAPFDKVIVTCSPEKVPQPLVDQLKEGGIMVVPVGERYQQTLYLFKKKQGELEKLALRPTLFVPMTGTAETARELKPDPFNPKIVNGTFEEKPENIEHLPGWYYQRQVKWDTDSTAPDGKHFATFHNDLAGRSSRALQGFAIDGRKIRRLQISAWVKASNVFSGGNQNRLPMIVLTLYTHDRHELPPRWLGPWNGTFDWKKVSMTIRVPQQAREGILRIGLFGASGEVSFDDVQLNVQDR